MRSCLVYIAEVVYDGALIYPLKFLSLWLGDVINCKMDNGIVEIYGK